MLVANINPTLLPYDARTLARYIGEAVETSIRRNSTVRVAYEDWWLSNTSVLERLVPNDYQVTAYYLPDEEGKPTDVYLYQGDHYIDKVERVETYNRVMAEQTDDDVAKYVEQQKKIAKFNGYVREKAINRVGISKVNDTPITIPEDEEKALEIPTPPTESVPPVYLSVDYGRRAVDAF